MITLRPSSARGHFNHGWLDTFHTFSFGEYHDPAHMAFGPLRVINEDVVAPGKGFDMHPHRDMEIITYILSGALEHRDSLGNQGVIRPGEIQRITAGRGILHAEYNPSKTEPVHLLQIWLMPNQRGATPAYDQKPIPVAHGALTLIASPDGRDGSMPINQDANLYAARFDAPATITHALSSPESSRRSAWVQIARGGATINGTRLNAGDGAAVTGEPSLAIHAEANTELLLFDLPA